MELMVLTKGVSIARVIERRADGPTASMPGERPEDVEQT